MDPDAALNALIDAVLEADFVAAREHLDALQDWTQAGGYEPRDPRPQEALLRPVPRSQIEAEVAAEAALREEMAGEVDGR